MNGLKPYIGKVAGGQPLSFDEAKEAFGVIMSGDATPGQIGAFLMALRVRGETIDEIAAAVSTMRDKMVRVDAPIGAIDIVGTGGDGAHSLNISTAAALVTAGAGVPVAKHGNRNLSSQTGTADVLMALGVKLDIDAAAVGRSVHEAGIGFMFAPQHHPAMRHVGPVRVELGARTIFNLLGPLTNPAGVKRQLVGVFAPEWVLPLAETLKGLGSERVWVAHGDGFDEIIASGETQVAELKDGAISTFTVSPEMVGLKRYNREELRGGDPTFNAQALRALLDGAPGAYRDTVAMNAGAGLLVAGKVDTFADGVTLALQSIDSGAGRAALSRLIEVSNR